MGERGPERPLHRDADPSSLTETVDRLVDTLVEAQAASTADAWPEEWGPSAGARSADYRAWLEARERAPGYPVSQQSSTPGPVVTVLVGLVAPVPAHLDECLRSVADQSFRSWELVLCSEGPPTGEVAAVVARFTDDPRVRCVTSLEGCVPEGEFVVLLGPEDTLDSGALARLASAASDPEVDVVYSDEDGLDESGLRCHPIFKPDWDPELMLTYPYLGDATAYRRSLLDRLGISLPVDPADRYDVELQMTGAARLVRHVPDVLYHARSPRTGADGLPVGATADEAAGHRALVAALARRGVDADVGAGRRPGWFDVRRAVPGPARVSVIVPFRDQAGLTRACFDSLDRAPGHPIHEVVFVDNGSTEPETRVLRQLLVQQGSTRVLDHPGVFNWAALNNAAASVCTGDLLLFLNNDIEATSDGWLRSLVEQAQRPDVGAVGARLVYPDGRLQHAGVVLGIQGLAAHLLAGLPPGDTAYLGWDRAVRSWTAVTGACMLVRRQVFEELGGFDEGYPVAFNDVDFCLRLRDAGYRVIATPHAELTHFESVSRGLSGYGADVQRFLARWGDALRSDDPFYNRNLSREVPWCGLRAPGEDEAWRSTLDGLTQPVHEDPPSAAEAGAAL